MSAHGDVAPSTLGVKLVDYGVEVEYLDGRTTVYRGVPEAVTNSVTTGPGKETHVLVTDPTETEGVMLYVNDLKTHDSILESSGVGRVILAEDESEEVFPGVTVSRAAGFRTRVEADPEVARGRVFVFVEDDWEEHSYEIVRKSDAERRDEWEREGDETATDARSTDAATADALEAATADAPGETDGEDASE